MKFGKYFAREVIPGWKHHYIQYNELKEDVKKQEESPNQLAFHKKVAEEVNRAVNFYELQRKVLVQEIEEAERTKHLVETISTPSLQNRQFNTEKLLLKYQSLGEQVTRLFHFLKLNATALRKILKKFNKRVPHNGPKLLSKTKLEKEYAGLAFNLNRLRDASLLQPAMNSVERGIVDLQQRLMQSESIGDFSFVPVPGFSPIASQRYAQYRSRGHRILQDMHAMREEMQESNEFLSFLSSRSVIPFRRATVRQQSVIEAENRQGKFSTSGEGKVILSSSISSGGLESEQDSLSQYINLASTFFYLANYNICLPTAAHYSQALGLRASSAGVIVAMTPVAAILSTVFYSFWSNYSFRQPLLCSSVFLVIGNVLYASAWDMGLSSFLLLGRFLIGLGGCRAVNRRYIADTISVQHRTRASAAFVAAGALGMASGPLLASLFADFDMVFLSVTLNEMTSPAWFMAFVWFAFGFLVALSFREPIRSYGLISIEEDVSALERTVAYTNGDDGTSDDDDVRVSEFLLPQENGHRVRIAESRFGAYDHEDEPSFDDRRQEESDDDDEDDEDDSSLRGGESSDYVSVDQEDDLDDSIDIVLEGRSNYGTMEDTNHRSSGATRAGEGDKCYGKNSGMNRGGVVSKKKRRRKLLSSFSLLVIFWVKLVQEALLTEIPLVTPDNYGWTVRRIGFFMVCLGLAVLPCNVVLVYLNRVFELQDSFWIRVLFALLVASSLSQVSLADSPISLTRYVLGDFGIFLCAQVLEGVIMSFFSKVISSKLAAGTFNSGFLATEAGTIGRAAGNAIITLLGSGTAVELTTNLSLVVTTLSFVMLAFSLKLFPLSRKRFVLHLPHGWKLH